MGLCGVEGRAFRGASPAMALAPAECLCVASQRCQPAAHGMMHGFQCLKGARLWSAARQLRSSSSGSWSEVASADVGVSKRRARGPIMAAAEKAAGGEDKTSTQLTITEDTSPGEAALQPPSSSKDAETNPSEKPKAAASPPKPKVAAAGGAKKAAKALAKPLPEAMAEDIVPELAAYFENEKGISDVEIKFDDNQLQGFFIKNQVTYNFWAYFPDGKFEGSRGFSLTSHGSPPSTVEPFLIDENKISSELVVQQVIKRLFAQRLLGTN